MGVWKDSKDRYGLVSILLHWMVAAFVVTLLAIIIYTTILPRPDGRPLRFLHVSIGLVFIPVYLARLFWRTRSGHPHTDYGGPFVTLLGEITWRVLLLAPLVMIATGPFLAWLHDLPNPVFNLFAIPSPVPENFELRRVLFEIHKVVGYAILAFLGLHLLGVLKHLIFDRDGVLLKMLVPARTDEAQTETGPLTEPED